MTVKVKLKNADKYVLLDHAVFETLSNVPRFKELNVLNNIREHSSGVPVFQKYIDMVDGKCKVESIYLASYISSRFIPNHEDGKRKYLSFVNGNKLDLRLKNLKWEPMNLLSRQRKTTHNKTGFRGVRKTLHGKFVSMISDGSKQIYLGTFDTAEDAALAYNKRSLELFGETPNLNHLDAEGRPVPFTQEKKKEKERKRKPRKSNTVLQMMVESSSGLASANEAITNEIIGTGPLNVSAASGRH